MYEYYNALLDNHHSMQEIDAMDFLGFLKLRAWKERKEREPKRAFIDEVWKAKPNV